MTQVRVRRLVADDASVRVVGRLTYVAAWHKGTRLARTAVLTLGGGRHIRLSDFIEESHARRRGRSGGGGAAAAGAAAATATDAPLRA
jgi:hypothetical protein